MKNNEIEDIRERWMKLFNAIQEYTNYIGDDYEISKELKIKYLNLEPDYRQSRQDVKDLLYHENNQNSRLLIALSALHQIKNIVDTDEIGIRPWGIQDLVNDALDSITKSLKEDGYDDTSTD